MHIATTALKILAKKTPEYFLNSPQQNQSEEYLNGLKGTTRVRIHVHKSLLQPTTTMLARKYRCDYIVYSMFQAST